MSRDARAPPPAHPLPPPRLALCNCCTNVSSFQGPAKPPLPLSSLRFYPVRVLRGACMIPRLFLTRRTRPCSHSCTQYVPTLVPMLVHYTYHPCPLDTSPSPHLLVYGGYVLCPFTDFVRFPSFGILARAPRYSPHGLRCMAHATHTYSAGAAATFGSPKCMSRLHAVVFLSVTHAAISALSLAISTSTSTGSSG